MDKKRNANATEEQKQILLSFMEDNINIGKGKFIDSIEGKRTYNSLWDGLAQSLNSSNGPTRDTAKWQRFWSDMKTRTKRKVAEIKRSRGGSQLPKSLSDIEERILIFILPEAADPEASNNEITLESDISLTRERIEEAEVDMFSETDVSMPTTPTSEADFTLASLPDTSKRRKIITRDDISLLLQQQKELNTQLTTINEKLDHIDSTLQRNNEETNRFLERIAVALERRSES